MALYLPYLGLHRVFYLVRSSRRTSRTGRSS